MTQGVDNISSSDVDNLKTRILALRQDLCRHGRVDVHRRDGILVQVANVSCSITAADIPKSQSSIHMARYGTLRIRSDINAIGSGTMPESCSLTVCLAGNIPNLKGPIGRGRQHQLLITKQSNGRDFVCMSHQLMNHSFRLEIPNAALFVTATTCDQATGNVTGGNNVARRPTHCSAQTPILCVPNLYQRIIPASRHKVGTGIVISHTGGLSLVCINNLLGGCG
mmetsp:Transcript_25252/g.58709  ORF Transcript_25252/g.58709 Transcript_25252/m.58709 type:complete len:224 (-) Transcript_25252:189-860(-)